MINLDINIGDIILTGRFKNKRVEVKEIGVDEHGNPTINGKNILKIRVEKFMKLKNQIKENKYPMLKVGTKIKVHKHSGIFVDGVITSRKGDYITYDSKIGSGGVNLNSKGLDDIIQFNESKQFKLADIAKKILKEEGFDKDGNPYGFKYDDELYYPKKGDKVEATFIGSNPKYKQFKNKPFIDVVTGVSSPSTEPWCAINFKNHGQIKDYNDWNFVKVS